MKYTKKEKIIFTIIVILGSLLALGIISEISARIILYFGRGTWKLPLKYNSEIGWMATPNYVSKKTCHAYNGGKYNCGKVTTNEYGFRSWGDLNKQKRIFVVGDSFTHSLFVSDQNTWYKVFGQKFNAEIFAYGCGGYGTLQEYMVIDKYYDIIKPDIVIVQFCFNDFSDNYYKNSSRIKMSNGFRYRPYLENGKIVYRNLRPLGFEISNDYSYVAYFIWNRVNNILEKYKGLPQLSTSENEILDAEADNVTRIILGKIRTRTSGTELYILPLCCKGLELKRLKFICHSLNINIILDAEAVMGGSNNKQKFLAEDGVHYNEEGDMVIGNFLSEWFNSREAKN